MQKFQRPHVRYAAALLCAGILASTWGCREVDEPCPVVSLTVTPNPLRLPANSTGQFAARGLDYTGNVVATSESWAVIAGGGAIDGDSGLFTAGSATGTFVGTVRATDNGMAALATVIVTAAVPPATLGSLSTFAVLAGSTITNTGATTTLEGDVGVSPGTAITGLPVGQPTGGSIYAGGGTAATAQTALTSVYNDLDGRACGTDLTGEDLGGMTLTPGTYCFDTSAGLTGTLTLNGQGNANAVFVIAIGSTLTTAPNAAVVLVGGAQAANVHWQVGSSATLGTGTAFRGNIVAFQSITLNAGSSLIGRALARNGAVTLDSSHVSVP